MDIKEETLINQLKLLIKTSKNLDKLNEKENKIFNKILKNLKKELQQKKLKYFNFIEQIVLFSNSEYFYYNEGKLLIRLMRIIPESLIVDYCAESKENTNKILYLRVLKKFKKKNIDRILKKINDDSLDLKIHTDEIFLLHELLAINYDNVIEKIDKDKLIKDFNEQSLVGIKNLFEINIYEKNDMLKCKNKDFLERDIFSKKYENGLKILFLIRINLKNEDFKKRKLPIIKIDNFFVKKTFIKKFLRDIVELFIHGLCFLTLFIYLHLISFLFILYLYKILKEINIEKKEQNLFIKILNMNNNLEINSFDDVYFLINMIEKNNYDLKNVKKIPDELEKLYKMNRYC